VTANWENWVFAARFLECAGLGAVLLACSLLQALGSGHLSTRWPSARLLLEKDFYKEWENIVTQPLTLAPRPLVGRGGAEGGESGTSNRSK
jgi:hypothetical protein